ncbi:peptidylprolyl isomerase [Heliobacillus mobilis]|uniref:Foldase protein PrsA n=1 Tax=Heliobacterium mobile TaxID=28064 RepID=A0A6I3SII2_HELMO|nr:peptidylprolyl isomerase [Heliobacterium mobile]MTV48467.1 peptidylprolyl isomerase [Heliobacterium mobile]
MRKSAKLLAVALLGTFLLSLVGCGSSSTVATVNGEKITRVELDKRVNRYKQNLEGDPNQKEVLASLEQQELERLIDEKLLMQEAKQRNIQVTDAQVDEELTKGKQNFPSDEEYQNALKQNGLTEPELKEMIRSNLIMSNLYDTLSPDVQVSDQDIQKYYKENPDKFKQTQQVKASHILLKTEEEAKAVIDQLKKGANFEQLAAEKSTDPTAAQNKGELGFFDRDAMVKEFSDAAFSMKKGEISKTPVKSNFGYHVIRVEDIKEARQLTLDEVKDQIKVDLAAEQKQQKFETWYGDVKAAAKIERKLPQPAAPQTGTGTPNSSQQPEQAPAPAAPAPEGQQPSK